MDKLDNSTTIFYMELMQRSLSSAVLFNGWANTGEFFAWRAGDWGDYLADSLTQLVGTPGVV